MKVVVGLGNPGQEYEKTRHNVGFRVVAELASRHGGGRPQANFEADIVDVMVAGEKTLLVAPTTFMNLSGRSVRQIVDFYKLTFDDLLVVCDDLNLDTGRLRLRRLGSAGGQKGLSDIITRLATEEVARLRIGIGRPQGRMTATDYVLGKFRKEEIELIDHAIVTAADAVESWIRDGIALTMNRVNAPADGER